MLKRRIVSGEEQDVHTPWRRLYKRYRRAGMAREVKTKTNQRERHEAHRSIREGRYDAL